MDYETAELWLNLIASAAALFWLASAWFAWSTRQSCTEPLVGEVTSPAAPERIRQAVLAALNASALTSPLANTEILAVSDAEIRWRARRGPLRHDGVLQVASAGNGTRVSYGIVLHSPLPTIGVAVVALALLCGAGLYGLLRETALSSEHPSSRAQVIQMVQAVHVLWPPFLLGGVARGARRRLGEEVERIVRNAAYS